MRVEQNFPFGKIILISHGNQGAISEFDRFHSNRGSDLICVAFKRPHHLRYTIASHGTGCRLVRKHCPAVNLCIFTGVKLFESRHFNQAYGMAMGSISARI